MSIRQPVRVIDGQMNRDLFDLYVKTQLVPTLQPGDVIVLDKLSAHKRPGPAAAMKDVGAWFLFLAPYSPDLNPIEMAFAQLNALIRTAAAKSYDGLWRALPFDCKSFPHDQSNFDG